MKGLEGIEVRITISRRIQLLALLLVASFGFGTVAIAQNSLDLIGLDNTAYSSAAYSLRRLSTSYSGNLIKVRRSSDNATQDIGYNAGNHLDTSALKTFVGAGSGYVDTWYDQSGNSRNQTQSSTTDQPRIVNSGVIERQNTQPAVYFNGVTYMFSPSFTTLSRGFNTAIIAGVLNDVTYNDFGGKTVSNEPTPFNIWGPYFYFGDGTSNGARILRVDISEDFDYGQWMFAADSTKILAYRFGVNNLYDTSAPLYYGDANVPLYLGSRADLITGLDGYIGEYILFPAVLSTGNRKKLERSQMNYMLPILGNTTLSSSITTKLTTSVSGGIWSSSATGVATVNSISGLVTGVSPGSASITYTTADSCSTITTVTVKTPGVGLNFDGTGDFVGVPNNSAFETTTGTIEAWLRIGWNSLGTNPCFISMRPTTVSNTRYSFHITGNRGSIGLWNGSSYTTRAFSFSQNVWYHIAIVYSTTVCSVYVNGSYIGNIASGIQNVTGHNLRIGAPDDTYPNEFWIGDLDEVRIWNTQRTATEIFNNAYCDIPQQAGLVGYYRFDEGIAGGSNTSAGLTADYSGNGNCGTLTNFTLSGTSSNYVTGSVGSCNSISFTTPAAITGTTSVCQTSTTTLANAVSGGTWSSSATGVATVGTTGIVTGVAAGTEVITYNLNCQIATTVVTVNALPTIGVGGNTIIYAGATTSLTANSGVSYTWSPGTGLSATTGATISANPSSSTSYTVTGISSAGCSNNATVTVSVNPVPTIAGSTACPGSVLTLTCTPQPINIVWQQAGVGVSTVTPTYAATATTVAGTGTSGSGANQLNGANGVYVDASGNIYIADGNNHRIQKWAPGATSGTMVAGTGSSGSGDNQLNSPTGVYVDAGGNIYLADFSNHRIQKWAPGATSGTMVAGTGSLGSAGNQLRNPTGVYVDADGNIYVADQLNHRIQKWAPGATSGITVAGNGTSGSGANELGNPYGVYLDAGSNIYVADYGNSRIQKWAPGATSGTTVAGTGTPGSGANQLSFPQSVYVDADGNIYVADLLNHRIQKWTPGATSGTTVAGTGSSGSGTNQLNTPKGVYVDAGGNICVADGNNHRIQQFAASIDPTYTAATASSYAALVTTQVGAVTTNTVTVNPLPASITGSDFCVGSSTTFNNATGGGTWSSSATGVATIGSATGIATGVSAGTTVITYRLSSTGCYSTTVVTVTANVVPTIGVGGNTIIFTGSSTTLTANGGTTYTWAPATGLSATTGATVVASPTATPTYTITGTSSAGCSNTAIVTVSVVPVPTIAGSTACPGSVLTLTCTPQPINIVWQQAGVGVSTLTPTYAASATTVAGTGTGGSGANQLNRPTGVGVDAFGNIYVADQSNHRIQKWAPGATSGTTVAGTGTSGSGANQFNGPAGVYIDASGNIYVVDFINQRIQKWAPGATSGTTVAGTGTLGSGTNQLNNPHGVYVDASGNIYVGDRDNHRIQQWAPGATSGTTVAGTGTSGSGANQLNGPTGVYVDAGGNIYVVDRDNHRIQQWAPGATSGTTVAGTGTSGSGANQLNRPMGVYLDAGGNIYVADFNNHRIQKWAPGATSGTTVAGTGTLGSGANQLERPFGVYVDAGGNIYVADFGNQRIQKFAASIVNTYTASTAGSYAALVTTQVGAVTTNTVTVNPLPASITGTNICTGTTTTYTSATGGGTWSSSATGIATIGSATGIATGVSAGTTVITYQLSSTGCYTTTVVRVNALPTIGVGGNTIIYAGASTSLTANSGVSYTWSPGTGLSATTGATISASPSSNISYTVTGIGSTGCSNRAIVTVSVVPVPTLTGTTACVGSLLTITSSVQPSQIEWQLAGAGVYTVTPTIASAATTVAGTGTFGSGANQLNGPLGAYADASGNIYVADQGNHRVQKWAPGATSGTTVAGNGTFGSGANQLNAPVGVYVDASGNVYVVDYANHRIQEWAPGATSGTTVAGTGTLGNSASELRLPTGVYGDVSGNIYVADNNNHRIQKWAPGATSGTTVAGTGTLGSGTNQLRYPTGVYVDASGNIYIADQGNDRVQKWAPGATSGTTVAGNGTLGSGANQLNTPSGVYVDASGNIYVADQGNYRIQKWAPGAASGTTVAGTGTLGSGANQLNGPASVVVDASGNIYVADQGNNRIQKFGASIVQTYTAAVAGNYTAAINTGMSAITTNTVTINPLPANITGSNICNGATTTYTSATGGGTWSSSAIGVATIGSATGIATGVSAGTTVITYQLSSTGCYTTTVVTVNPLPASITGSDFCVGSTTTYNNATGGGTWSSSATGVATIGSATGIATGVSTGTTVITYQLSSTGCYTTTVITVNLLLPPITGTTTVCPLLTTTLANVTGGGAWSSSATGVATIGTGTGLVTGVAAGTSSITYIQPTGCFATAVVTVNPTPAVITGTASACAGFTRTLSSATPSGNWSSSAGAVATVGTLTGVVTAVSAGTTTITYTRSNGCYTTATFTTNPLPAAIGGTGSVCVGFTATYTNATGGGTWSSSATTVATVGSGTGVVTGVAVGAATITYTLGTGCRATGGVTVSAVPTAIGGTAKACVGFSSTLFNTTGGGTWSSSDAGIASIGSTTGVTTGVSAGTATITYTRSNGCFATKVYTVNALPAAIGGTTTICVGQTSTLTNATGGGAWRCTAPSFAPVGVSSGIVTGVAETPATITYTLSSGCYATTGFTVNASPSAIGGIRYACEGFSTRLYNFVGGGVWSSSNTGIASIGTTGITTGVSAGTATITYMRSNGCYTVTTYSVNAAPAAITGTLSACIGFASTLSSATGGGTWTSTAPVLATVGTGTGTVTALVAGNTNITYSISNGCFAIGNFTVNAQPANIGGTTNVCVGGTATLTNATGGGSWSVSNANATMGTGSGVVTGVSAGTAVVTYTLSTGCYKTTNINIYDIPAAISGTGSVCAGGTTTLSNSVGGGTWSSSATTIATVGSATGIVTGVAGGTATISYATGGTCFTTFTTTIGAILPVTGTPSACTGSTSTLRCGSAGGTWSSSDVAVATIGSTGIMTGVSVGTSIITYALPSGCARYVTVYISDPGSSISGPSSVCVGQTINLTTTTHGGAWTSSNGGIALVGLYTGVVTGRVASSATITYTIGSSCYMTKSVTVNAFSPSYAAVTSVMVGNTITVGNTMAGGTWSSSAAGVATVNSTTGVVTGVSAGTASISYTVASGCTDYINVTVIAAPAVITGPTTVCVGQDVTLSSTTPGGVWTSANGGIASVGSSTGIVTGRMAAAVNITYTVGGGYSVRTVTVNAFTPSYSSTYTLMIGNTLTMVNPTAGGTWSSTNTGAATVNSTSGLVTGVGAGTTTISYIMPSGCADGNVVTVTAAPSAITGPSVVCFGQTATLTSATPGGVWTSSNGGIATVGSSSGIVTPLLAATVNITYTVGSGYAVKTMTVANFSAVYASVTTINSGSTTTIFNSTPGGVWSSSAPAIATVNSTTGVVTGVLTGTTMISYTMPTGCADGIMVTVSPAPAIGTGPGTVCVGSSLTLTHATPGGVWTSSNGGIALVGSSSGIVTGRIASTCTITYTLPSTVYVTTTITVLPLATITGQTRICQTQSLTLTNSIAGGTWFSSNSGVAAAGSATGVISGVSMGTSIISYVLPSGCYTLKTVTVVAAIASITGTTVVCEGSSVALSHPVTGGVWNSSASGIATADLYGGSITGVSAGTATITYTLGPGCKTTATFTVNAVPAAISGGNSVCVSTPVTLTSATGGGEWTSLDPSIATVGSADGLVTGITPGFSTTITYTLPVTGCYAVNTMAVNPCRFAGEEELTKAANFTLIPNPNNGTFMLKGNYATQAGEEEVSIEVMNTLGQTVYRSTVTAINGRIAEQIQLKGTLANGMYLLNLHTPVEHKVFHFVISK